MTESPASDGALGLGIETSFCLPGQFPQALSDLLNGVPQVAIPFQTLCEPLQLLAHSRSAAQAEEFRDLSLRQIPVIAQHPSRHGARARIPPHAKKRIAVNRQMHAHRPQNRLRLQPPGHPAKCDVLLTGFIATQSPIQTLDLFAKRF